MSLIPLVDPDLNQEETILRILLATKQFNETANNLFQKLDSRIVHLTKELDRNIERFKTVNSKISSLEKLDTAVVLKAPSKFPEIEYVPVKRILPYIPGVRAYPYSENEQVFIPKTSLGGSIDLKNELEQRKNFFTPSQLMPSKIEANKTKPVPQDLVSVADLFYEESDLPAFEGMEGAFFANSSKSKSVTSKFESSKSRDFLDKTAISGRKKVDENDPFAFRPLSSDIPDLDLPDFLPDLPGVALDVILTELPPLMANTLPDFDQKSYPTFNIVPDVPSTPPVIAAPVISNIPVPPPPPPAPPISMVPPLAPIIAPPPPPPPPSALLSPPPPPPPSLAKSPMISPGETDGRSDLMAAIRAAGGVGKMKLKSAKSTAPISSRLAEEKQSLKESSALPSSSGGGDLMSSLAKALESRRKAMTGSKSTEKSTKITGVMSRISEMIPHSEEATTHTDSGGEEWN